MKQDDVKLMEAAVAADIEGREIPAIKVEFENIRIPLMNMGIPFDAGVFRNSVEDAYEDRNVNSCKDVNGKGPLGKISGIFKKIIRKITCFYVEPVVEDQNTFNGDIVELMLMLCDKNEVDNRRNKVIEEKLFKLENRCSALEAENEELKKKLGEIE